jgi:hypothetical protein
MIIEQQTMPLVTAKKLPRPFSRGTLPWFLVTLKRDMSTGS